ncbi:transcriptional regulator [Pseudoroseomonas aestuarii]|uniref:Transcriptional regulator n=1 Tax=Teichococcus aestuarii TaxID=568898 RepID=A0A2U1UZ89_9PROT|nr:transcriptional regulator [Pseudoroseomonas aestuarii]
MLPLSAGQCRQARNALGLSAVRLASLAGISGETLLRFEKGSLTRATTVQKIYAALEAAGAEFTPEDSRGARACLKSRGA